MRNSKKSWSSSGSFTPIWRVSQEKELPISRILILLIFWTSFLRKNSWSSRRLELGSLQMWRLYILRMKRMLKFLKSLLLLVVSIALACVMLPLGILWTSVEIGVRFFFPCWKSAGEKSLGYLSSIIRSIAIGLDQIGNSVCRDMLNRLLITSGGYSFGRIQETISSVLGKNEKSWTLTRLGRAIVAVLDRLDPGHCEKSIQDFIS